jgi:hypothetical protein
MSPSERVGQIRPQAQGSRLVSYYDSQGYGGGILTRLHAEYGALSQYLIKKFAPFLLNTCCVLFFIHFPSVN